METPTNTNPRELAFWQDRVSKSHGTAVLLPESLHEELKTIIKLEAEGKELSNKVAKLQVEGSTRMGDLWLKFRQHLDATGQADNWLKEIGLDQVALDNGFFVVNVLEKNGR